MQYLIGRCYARFEKIKLTIAIAIVVAVVAAAGLAHAQQNYPSRPVRLIVPFASGSSPDIQARLIASELSKQMGQQVVVDNRGGASGIIGNEAIAKAAPDGYTFGSAALSFITNPIVFTKLPYDTAKDFQPVVIQSRTAFLIAATPALPVRSVQELIEHARAQPGKLSYGTAGAVGGQTLSLELLRFMTGTQIVQVSYKGIQRAITDTIAGQVHIVCDALTSTLPHIRAERLRVLGVTSLKRWSTVPDIPTIAESGAPGFEVVSSPGYMLPARTPRDIVLRLNSEINKALESPTVAEKFIANGAVIVGGTPEQFAEHLRRETLKWAGVIKAAGIKPQ